jgi:FixJ family two-component response regulator
MNSPTVFLVDDSKAGRDSVSLMLRTAGHEVETYAGAEAFLDAYRPGRSGCRVLDLRMPGMSGVELQEELARRGIGLPIVFISVYGDVATTVRAMRSGAVDFLTKPVDGSALLARVRSALDQDARRREQLERRRELEDRLARLSAREREVLAPALAGSTSGEIALQLQISPRTVETHRAHILLKLNVRSLLEFTQSAVAAGISIAEIGAAPPPNGPLG